MISIMDKKNINKTAAYFSSFNPPTTEDFTNIINLLDEYDTVVVSPLVSYPDKFYRKAISYGKRLSFANTFLTDSFPKIKERLILLDLKSEMNLDRPRANIENCFKYIQDRTIGKTDFYIAFEDLQEKQDLLKIPTTISPTVLISDCNYKSFVRNELRDLKNSISDSVENVKDYLCPSLCLEIIKENPYKVIKRNLHTPK